MNVRRELKINWPLWACLSMPVVAYNLFATRVSKAGDRHSNWSDILDNIASGFSFWNDWPYWQPIVLWTFISPLLLGWIAQYFITLAWETWCGRRH